MNRDIQDWMRRAWVKEALKVLQQPSLRDALDPTKYRIVRITNHGIEVVPVETKNGKSTSR